MAGSLSSPLRSGESIRSWKWAKPATEVAAGNALSLPAQTGMLPQWERSQSPKGDLVLFQQRFQPPATARERNDPVSMAAMQEPVLSSPNYRA